MRRIGIRMAAAAAASATNTATGAADRSRDDRLPLLFTPGPLQTSRRVKQAMMKDYGSRDSQFVQCIKDVRAGLLKVANVSSPEWTAVPMQGSGTMGVEAAIRTTRPKKDACVAVIANGAYGTRINNMCRLMGAKCIRFDSPEGKPIDLAAFEKFMKDHGAEITNFAIVHSETSTGMFNPIKEAHDIVRKHAPNAVILLDAMSSFGAVEIDVPNVCDLLISSSNKCLQGVPGFSFVIARSALLDKCRGNSDSLTLDVSMQNDGLNKTSQFSFTPPVQIIMAFREALREHEEEGGVAARAKRYQSLAKRTAQAMKALGFTLFLEEDKPHMGHIITAYNTPKHPKWNFTAFNDRLREKGVVLYPGKASHADTFRIGSIGDLHMDDVEMMIAAVTETLKELDIDLTKK
jgi:2-aminoethylphosphonate-pyruvate transaminase